MNCYIYKSLKKTDFYLFIPVKDNFSEVPEELRILLGRLDFLFELDLEKKSRLASVDSKTVMDNIRDKGYYLQIPPKTY